MKPLRDLLKHSSVYMVGQILTRMASVLLLPFYTHVLTTADYGVTAILDLTAAILGTFIAGGLVSAIARHHFDDGDTDHHDKVWWTGLTMVVIMCFVICLPMYLGRQVLADITLGKEISSGAWFYALTTMNLWLTVIATVLDAYLRVMKWSSLFVAISLGRLVINVGLNVYFMIGLNLGVEGLLIGNLIATALHSAAMVVVFIRSRGGYQFERKLANEMFRFASPLVFTALAGMLMHEADRYFLRIWVSLDEVGIYSLAHKIGFAVHTLCLIPFHSIWHVAIYDIERMDDSKRVFAKVFEWFTSGLGILILGACLSVHPVLPLLTPDDYSAAIDLIAVVLLGFYLFAMSSMFEVPSLLKKKTGLMVPGSIVGLTVNIVANVLLIPIMGAWGAGVAGVLTYFAYSAVVLHYSRQADQIPYPWKASFIKMAALMCSFFVVRFLIFPIAGPWVQLAVSVGICALLAFCFFGREGLPLVQQYLKERRLAKLEKSIDKPATFQADSATN
ncbi:MAG: lipopolysaccharide biosynthesis protein [Fuerstiella sp.]